MARLIARLWYAPGSRIVSVDLLQKRLTENLGCTVEKLETGAEMPVLRVTAPAHLLLRIENHDSIAMEASDIASQIDAGGGRNPAADKLRGCTRRIDIGAEPETDPDSDTVRPILTGLTSGLDAVLEDCVHGRLTLAQRPKKSLMQKLLGR
ncbi:hypothetical protein [Shimia sp. SDUM112013]|uniref:hypothetical protein n=1 Tax=Shimia sp. SDUM112013 TaxID=3136160 RepID=UPI0032EE381C